MTQTVKNLAILWDIENVTPLKSDNLFIEGVMEYAESLGRVVSSFAYADWSRPAFRELGTILAERYFRLVHVPRGRKGKNSADIQLVSDAMDLLRFYEHIDRYILLTGDSDFRPLLLSLRKSGKRVHVVCDLRTASQGLLALADGFVDYRDLLPSTDTEEEENEIEPSKDYWFERLVEASHLLQTKNKAAQFSLVKLQMRLLNPDFHEAKLGFKRFTDFVMAAMRAGYISIQRDSENAPVIQAQGDRQHKQSDTLHAALKILCNALKELDKNAPPQFHSYNQIGSYLTQKSINLRDLGFSQLKKFVQAAETRGLVETKFEDMTHYTKLIKQGE